MKKLFCLAALACVGATAVLASCGESSTSDFKVGVILVGDETEGYTAAHMNGVTAAVEALGLDASQVIYKKKVEETDDCYNSAVELVEAGCKLVMSNSYGHQDYMAKAAKENSDVQFVSCTGDYAAISGLSNFKNAFTEVYESRYVSGVVAGMKLAELDADGKLTDKNKDADGKVKVGYVGAYNYAEVISGYTSFFLGVQSVYPNVSMEVQYTSSWFDIDKEAATAETLVKDGCVIIGQHADSTGAPSKCESLLKDGYVCYSVGYNVDMLSVAPNAALTSATNNWGVYYTYAIGAAMKGETIVTDWAEGYDKDAVAITTLGTSCAAGTANKVSEVEAALKAGTLNVFDTSTFTVSQEKNPYASITLDADSHVTSNKVDLSYKDWSKGGVVVYQGDTVETVVNGNHIAESLKRSAPYFSLIVDGITELN